MKRIFLYFIISCSFYTQPSTAIEQEKINSLTELMIAGCSLGQRVEISAAANGGITLLLKGVEGKFSASKSEIPSIINFIASDELKGKQADNTRTCMQNYMDKIFDEVLGNKESASQQPRSPENLNGLIFKLNKCNLYERNKLNCDFSVTSAYQDRSIDMLDSISFDNLNNEYYSDKINIANHASSGRSSHGVFISNIPLIADTTTQMTINFSNISTQASKLALLQLDIRGSGNVTFRDIPFK